MRTSSRLGPIPAHDYWGKEDQLSDWVQNSNSGIIGFEHSDFPPECIDFAYSQYERFKVPMPKHLDDVVLTGIRAALWYMDCADPYALFSGISDVDMTTEWSEHAYEIIDDKRTYEVNPENVETFRYAPGQDEAVFNQVMSFPGLEALPNMLGTCISDVLGGEYGYHERYEVLDPGVRSSLEILCTRQDGTLNTEMRDAYFDLAAWSAAAWFLGPLARDFRYRHHDIYHTVVNYGEAILVDGSVISPKNYRKLTRPPKSCMICGTAAWCVEMTASCGGTRYMCEHCLSEGMPPSTMATCGSKRCLLTACWHHPYHHMGAAGVHGARRDFGQLGAPARGESVLRIKGGRG